MKKLIILSLIILFLDKTQNVLAQNNLFIVDNIEVTGKTSGNNYRERYLQIAIKKGFQSLIEKILQKEDQRKILSTDLKTIKSLTQNYRIIEEESFGDNYKLKLAITFDRSLLNNFFFKNNISYSEVRETEVIVYPILILGSELQLFSENFFIDEWNENTEFENIKFILPVMNVEDIQLIKNNLSNLEETNLDRLFASYEAENSVVLVLRNNRKKLNVFFKTNFKGAKRSKKIEINVDNLKDKDSRARVIKELKIYINELWKKEHLIDISVPSYLVVNTKIKKPGNLRNIVQKLKQIDLIEDYFIEELEKNSARIKIKYFGKIKNLQSSFVENGFKLKISNNEWSLSLSNL